MAEVSWPASSYNSGAVTEAEYERLAARFADDGVYWLAAGSPVVSPGSGLQVLVQANLRATVRGFYYESGPTGVALAIDSNGSGATRVDRVVLRLDRSTWEVRAAIRQGTPGSGAPTLVRQPWDTGVWEIPLALVTVPSGASSITSGNIAVAPLWVGSRSRVHLTSQRDPAPFPGQINYAYDLDAYERWDGSSWKTIIEDTGPIPLTLASGWRADGSCTGRRRNGIVEITLNLRLALGSGSGIAEGGEYRITTLPTSLRPIGQHKWFFVHITDDNNGRLDVQTDGTVWLRHLWKNMDSGNDIRATLTYIQGGS